jgi:hypothetical protein
MDQAAFIRWALDDARTVEERYTTELLVELGVSRWNARHKIYRSLSLEQIMERNRQRYLNPAYEPRYTAAEVEKAAEALPEFKECVSLGGGYQQRPIRDLKVLAFLTQLEMFWLSGSEVADVSVFAQLPNLRVLKFSSERCLDWRPLAECRALRELELGLDQSWWHGHTHWPDVTGLERLEQLEKLSLTGNLLMFAPGVCWPKVRTATLRCQPLAAPDLRRLPQLPACELLTLAGVERLDGIGLFPRLRNLKLETGVRDFAPLAALEQLTCFECNAFEPHDVSPLARLPRLQVAAFDTRFKSTLHLPAPRDFAVLAESPSLRELHVAGCPPVEAEVRMVNSLLTKWNDELLAPAPRPVPDALRFIVAPWKLHPRHNEVITDPEDNGLPDEGLRAAEGRWVARFAAQAISARLGCADWGEATADALCRRLGVEIQAFAVVEKLPEIVAATRSVLAQLRHEYKATIQIHLKSPELKPTPEREQLEQQFRERQEEEEAKIREQEQKELLERLHRYELKKQLGEVIKPEDFAPPPRPVPPPDDEPEEMDDDDGYGDGDVKVEKKPDPPQLFLDDEHPLAENYRLYGVLTLAEFWVGNHHRDIAVYLMGRKPDQEFPEEKPAA